MDELGNMAKNGNCLYNIKQEGNHRWPWNAHLNL